MKKAYTDKQVLGKATISSEWETVILERIVAVAIIASAIYAFLKTSIKGVAVNLL